MECEGVNDDEEHDLVDAIATANLEAMLPRLARYAEQRLSRVGWFTTSTHQTHKMGPKELVDLAIERCLEGERHWTKSSGCPDLESFLRGVIKSLVWSAVKADGRNPTKLDEHGDVDRMDARSVDVVRTEIVAAIEGCASDDDELTAFYLTVLDGHTKREDIASALGWDVARVSRVRIRLQRRLETQHPELFGELKKRRTS